MSRPQIQERAVKIVDTDVTRDDRPEEVDVASDADTHVSPGLRPEVLGDAAQRRTKAMIQAALFKVAGEASTIGPYQVLKLLGEGGMGVVYAAYDDKLERKVALKLIRGAAMRRPDGRARTLREARALARLSHPNVVHVYQVGEVDDEIYVAMEFLTGPTLRAWLAAQPRTWREVLAVFRQAGEGLAAAHREGVIHRDFEPANVIVGDDGRVRVLDFGLAHFFGLDGEEGEARLPACAGEVTDVLLTQTGAVLGTPAYMAAEQFAGARGDAKTDQFSFCTALYEALYGQRPFVGDRLDALASAVAGGRVEPVKARREVPPWLHRVVVRGLQPDPAARWPSMQALLAALSPPVAGVRWGRIVGFAGAAGALLVGGLGYAYMLEAPPPPPVHAGPGEAAAAGQEAVIRSNDAKQLVEARAALATDPLRTIRALTVLAGDDAPTWQQARFLAEAAAVRGLPAQVLRAGDRLEAWPLAGVGFIGRDEYGAVWRGELPGGDVEQVLPPGASTGLVVARDVPVWAVIANRTVQVFGADRAQTIDVGDAMYRDWRLAADGRTLVASTTTSAQGVTSFTVHLWDLTRPGSLPRTIAVGSEGWQVSADASIVVAREGKGIRVIRPREGTETLLKHRGQPRALSADGKFVITASNDRNDVMEVIEIRTGKSRRFEAESVTVLGGDEVLFTRIDYGRPWVRRVSLASGAVAWRLPLADQAGTQESRLVVDPANEQFAVVIGEAWGIGDLRRGALTSFVTVPKDSSPQWAGAGALMVAVHSEVRIYRPAASPVQLHRGGTGCGLSPGGRWAVVMPDDITAGAFTRVELATNEVKTFRCPSMPPTDDLGGRYHNYSASAFVDDAGQVAMFGRDGWSCWWDEQQGARAGARALSWGHVAALPRGVALAEGAEVEVWSGPQQQAQRWTAAAPVKDLQVSPAGNLLAVRGEAGVQVLHVETGAAMAVSTRSRPTGAAELQASALAWSPDGARLALLDKVEASLELTVWDVTGEPREVVPQDHVTLGGHVLRDSPGRPRNILSFTPAGTAVVLSNRHQSLLRVDLATHETQQLDVPELLDLLMRGETDAIGVDIDNVPFMIDLAARGVSPLTPSPKLGGSTRPPIRRGADGSVWTCAALGPGTLIEVAASEGAASPALRERLFDVAAFP